MGDGEEDKNVLSLINFDDDFLFPPHFSLQPPLLFDCEEGFGGAGWLGEIEQILLKDDDDAESPSAEIVNHEDPLPLDFFADLDLPLFIQGGGVSPDVAMPIDDDYLVLPPQDDDSTNQSPDNKSNNQLGLVFDEEEEEEEKSNISSSEGEDAPIPKHDASQDKDHIHPDDNDDADDPITKKRKRQMRNRDAAVRSRERKKMYVKDLEVKSKYLEVECIRLQRLLHSCAAENHALHLQLQKEKAITASRTMQESAVLLLESLLLGSLLWFLGIMGLFPPLELDSLLLPARMLVNVGSNNQEVVDLVALGRAESKRIGLGTLRLFFKSKRCKASRSKMKNMACYGAVLA